MTATIRRTDTLLLPFLLLLTPLVLADPTYKIYDIELVQLTRLPNYMEETVYLGARGTIPGAR
jgi:hypothetical protein